MKNVFKKDNEIYIVSLSEKIKESTKTFKEGLNGDWFYNTLYDFIARTGDITPYDVKIILTTDENLIKDGIQSIDDKFLKWFVSNPTCEEVVIYIKVFLLIFVCVENKIKIIKKMTKEESERISKLHTDIDVTNFNLHKVKRLQTSCNLSCEISGKLAHSSIGTDYTLYNKEEILKLLNLEEQVLTEKLRNLQEQFDKIQIIQ